MKILFAITSYFPVKQKFLGPILANYTGSMFASHSVDVVLCTHYSSSYDNVSYVSSSVDGWHHAHACNHYVMEHYKDYDFLVLSDDDVQVTPQNLEYYQKYQSLPMDYIPGFITVESGSLGYQFISMNNLIGTAVSGSITISGSKFIIPKNLHTPATIIDKDRFSSFVASSGGIRPISQSWYDVGMMSRSGIYLDKIQKVVANEAIISESAYMRHIPQKYYRNVSWSNFALTPKTISKYLT